jgi:hypothetical protein
MTMHQYKRFVTAAAVGAIAATMLSMSAGPAVAAPPLGSTPGGPTFVPLSGTLRRCDFSDDTHTSNNGVGSAFAVISRPAANTVTAEVHLIGGIPGIYYGVRLIEMPRPVPNRCGVGDPGTAVGTLNTDGGGNATVTIQGDVAPGTTGVWVIVEGPPGDTDLTGDFYTSDFVAAI